MRSGEREEDRDGLNVLADAAAVGNDSAGASRAAAGEDAAFPAPSLTDLVEYKVLQTGADVLELKYTSQDKQININEVASLEWGGLSGLGGEATIVWRGQRFVDPNRFARFVYQVKLRELKQQMAGRESGGDPGGVTEVSRVKGWQTVKDAVSKQSLEKLRGDLKHKLARELATPAKSTGGAKSRGRSPATRAQDEEEEAPTWTLTGTDVREDPILRRLLCAHDGCTSVAKFGADGGPPRHCAAHRGDGNVLSDSQLCSEGDCLAVALWGAPGGPATCCRAHRREDMVLASDRLCARDGCKRPATHGDAGDVPQHCAEHGWMAGGVEVTLPLAEASGESKACGCDGCDNLATVGRPGVGRERCELHMEEGMLSWCSYAACPRMAEGMPPICRLHWVQQERWFPEDGSDGEEKAGDAGDGQEEEVTGGAEAAEEARPGEAAESQGAWLGPIAVSRNSIRNPNLKMKYTMPARGEQFMAIQAAVRKALHKPASYRVTSPSFTVGHSLRWSPAELKKHATEVLSSSPDVKAAFETLYAACKGGIEDAIKAALGGWEAAVKRSLVEAAQTHKPVLVGARCDEGNCTRPPRYGAEGQLPTRCVLHKQPGQVELRGRCAEPGTWPTCGESPCTRRATFNKPGVLPPVACALHKTAGMELVVRLSKAPSSAPRAGASAAHAGAKGPKVEVRGGLAAVGQPAPQALAPAVADVAMAEGDAVDRAGAAAAGVAGGDGQAVAVAPFPVAPGAALGPALGKRPAEGNAADEAERKRARSATQFDLPDTALAAGAPGPDAPAQEERAELGAAPKLPAPTRMQTRGRHVVIPGVKRVEKVDTEAGVGPLQRGPLPGGAGQGATPGVDPGVPVPIAPLAPNARPVLPIGGEGFVVGMEADDDEDFGDGRAVPVVPRPPAYTLMRNDETGKPIENINEIIKLVTMQMPHRNVLGNDEERQAADRALDKAIAFLVSLLVGYVLNSVYPSGLVWKSLPTVLRRRVSTFLQGLPEVLTREAKSTRKIEQSKPEMFDAAMDMLGLPSWERMVDILTDTQQRGRARRNLLSIFNGWKDELERQGQMRGVFESRVREVVHRLVTTIAEQAKRSYANSPGHYAATMRLLASTAASQAPPPKASRAGGRAPREARSNRAARSTTPTAARGGANGSRRRASSPAKDPAPAEPHEGPPAAGFSDAWQPQFLDAIATMPMPGFPGAPRIDATFPPFPLTFPRQPPPGLGMPPRPWGPPPHWPGAPWMPFGIGPFVSTEPIGLRRNTLDDLAHVASQDVSESPMEAKKALRNAPASAPVGMGHGMAVGVGPRDVWAGTDDMTPWRIGEPPELVTALAVSSAVLGSGSQKGSVWLWDLHGHGAPEELTGHAGPVSVVAFAANGALVLSGSADGSLRVWTVASKRPVLTVSAQVGPITCMAVREAADGGRAIVAIGGTSGKVEGRRLFYKPGQVENATIELAFAAWEAHAGRVVAVTWHGDSTLVTAGADTAIRAWRHPTKRSDCVTVHGSGTAVTALAGSTAPGFGVLVGDASGAIYAIEGLPDAPRLKALDLTCRKGVAALAVDSQGRSVLAGARGRVAACVYEWTGADAAGSASLELTAGPAQGAVSLDETLCVAISADGQWVALSSKLEPGQVFVQELHSGERRTLSLSPAMGARAQGAWGAGVAHAPGGDFVLSLNLEDRESREQLARASGAAAQRFQDLAFSDDVADFRITGKSLSRIAEAVSVLCKSMSFSRVSGQLVVPSSRGACLFRDVNRTTLPSLVRLQVNAADAETSVHFGISTRNDASATASAPQQLGSLMAAFAQRMSAVVTEEVRTQTYRVDGAGDSMWTLEGSGSGWGTKPAPTLPANQKVKDTEKMTKGMSEGDGTGARGGSEPVIMREGGAGAGAGGIVGGGAGIPLTEGERCLLTFRLEEGPVVTELVRVMTLLDDPTGELVVLEREAPSTDVGDLVVSVLRADITKVKNKDNFVAEAREKAAEPPIPQQATVVAFKDSNVLLKLGQGRGKVVSVPLEWIRVVTDPSHPELESVMMPLLQRFRDMHKRDPEWQEKFERWDLGAWWYNRKLHLGENPAAPPSKEALARRSQRNDTMLTAPVGAMGLRDGETRTVLVEEHTVEGAHACPGRGDEMMGGGRGSARFYTRSGPVSE